MKSLSILLVRLVLWSALAATMFPLFWVFLTSFKPSEISQALPPVWNFAPTLQNYRDVMTGTLVRSAHHRPLTHINAHDDLATTKPQIRSPTDKRRQP